MLVSPGAQVSAKWRCTLDLYLQKELHVSVGALPDEGAPSCNPRECELYENHRDLLSDVADLLGTVEWIQALAKFLETSGAVTKTGKPRREREPWPPVVDDDEESKEEGSEDGYGGDEVGGGTGSPARKDDEDRQFAGHRHALCGRTIDPL
ncbi:hypothetical protein B0H16DRAFT_1726762 [Mycena metata]|uniref:Uncharacterized protein n=1 Tax=Mycena metata TaxID=1033252 RepID=A0AAD7N4Y5_9AGAR|nr:hypothetical protein B0H16DRAFT_1726762 [Mycena metata]